MQARARLVTSDGDPLEKGSVKMRDTAGQDVVRESTAGLRKTWWIAGGLTVLLVLFLAVGPGVTRWLAGEKTLSSARVRLAEAQMKPFIRDLSVRGQVVAAKSPTVFAKSAGVVAFVAQPGDLVNQGDLLATIESPELANELETQESALIAAEVALERQRIQARRTTLTNRQSADLAKVRRDAADRELRRAERSQENQLISEIDFEKAKDDLARAELEYRHAEENLKLEDETAAFEVQTMALALEQQQLRVDELRRRVEALSIRSPVTGMVGNQLVEERTSVGENQALLAVVDLSEFEVSAFIPEAYADDLGLGMPAEVEIGGQRHAATISAISPEVQNNEVESRLRFEGGAPSGLRQNQRMTARIIMDAREAVLTLPRGPFVDDGLGRIAYVVDAQGVATRRAIQLGARSIQEVEIVSGISAGETVIISGINDMLDYETVRLVD